MKSTMNDARMSITDLDTGASYTTHVVGSWKDSLIRWYNSNLADGTTMDAVEIVQTYPEVDKMTVRVFRSESPNERTAESGRLSVVFEGGMPALPDKTNL